MIDQNNTHSPNGGCNVRAVKYLLGAALFFSANANSTDLCLGQDISSTRAELANILPAYFQPEGNGRVFSPVICAPDQGISPDENKDISVRLNALIAEANEKYEDSESNVPIVIYLPSGEYLVESQIVPKSGVRLVGANRYAPTVLRSVKGAVINTGGDWHTPLDNFQLEQLYLDNITANFGGGKKTRVASILNVFYNTRSQDAQLLIAERDKYVLNNVFLRNKNSPGIGLYSYRTKSATISGNIFGNAIHLGNNIIYNGTENNRNEYDGVWVLESLVGNNQIAQHKAYLSYIKNHVRRFYEEHLDEKGPFSSIINGLRRQAQGNFTMAWFSNEDQGTRFSTNLIEGDGEINAYNPSTGKRDLSNSMFVTLVAHKNMLVEKNYFGQYKPTVANIVIRNGEKLTMQLNHLRNMNINQRDWEDAPVDGFYIHANRFSEAAKYEYYSNSKASVAPPPKDVILSFNIFENETNQNVITNVNSSTLLCTISTIERFNTNSGTLYNSTLASEYGYIPEESANDFRAIKKECLGDFQMVPMSQLATMAPWATHINYGLRSDYIGGRFPKLGRWHTWVAPSSYELEHNALGYELLPGPDSLGRYQTWSEANNGCATKGSGWRLPNSSELTAISAGKTRLPDTWPKEHLYWTSEEVSTPIYKSVYLVTGNVIEYGGGFSPDNPARTPAVCVKATG